jgi:nicotinate-nucleotide--dimethylbenzimidazole phosphoribosyltransferase
MVISAIEPSFDDIRRLLERMPDADARAGAAVSAREAVLVKPAGALGRLEEITHWLAAWQGKSEPTVERPLVAVFAASHGVTKHGVSAYPPQVTRQMLDTLSAGGAAINQICTAFGIELKVFDMAVAVPTQDICETAAMDEKTCASAIASGMEAIADGTDLLCPGEVGIGNTTVAAAIYHALWDGRPQDWVGPGTGLDAEGLARKAAAIARAIALHRDHLRDPLQVLRRLGGREIAAIAGAILAARLRRIPVLLDGFVVTAAAAVLHAIDPRALDHCRAAHRSAEPAHDRVLTRLGLVPLLSLGLRLGEGTGAALAVPLLKAAIACHRGMATFAEAGVAQRT